jgi:ribosomal protein L37AE/L43A
MTPLAPVGSQVTPPRVRPTLGVAREVFDTRARFERPCPSCRRRLSIRAAYAGKVIQCKRCSARFVPDGPTLYSELFLQLADAMAQAGLWDRPEALAAMVPAPAVA